MKTILFTGLYLLGTCLFGQVTCKSEQQAVDYCRAQIAKGATSFRTDLPASLMKRVDDIGFSSIMGSDAISVRMKISGNSVTWEPIYGDDIRILNAYRNPSLVKNLSSREKKALAKAREIASTVAAPQKTAYGKALALQRHLVGHGYWDRSMKMKSSNEVSTFLLDKRGVCSGYARTYRVLLEMSGVRSMLIAGTSNRESHIWNLVHIDGSWMHVDCTHNDSYKKGSDHKHLTFFGMTDDQIAKDHQWTRKHYPAAKNRNLYYYNKMGMTFNTVDEFIQYMYRYSNGRNWCKSAYIKELESKRLPLDKIVAAANAKAPHGLYIMSYSVSDRHPAVLVLLSDGRGKDAGKVQGD